MKVKYFKNSDEFRKWMDKYHDKEKELFVGYYKVKTGKATISWSDSVDVALCYGWVDSIRQSIDDESYCNRFTPRRPKSKWSDVNIKKVERLTAEGLMKPAGLKIFNERNINEQRKYSFEEPEKELKSEYLDLLKRNKIAYNYFSKQAPSYKKLAIHWILSAKQEKTQMSRLEKLIDASIENKRLNEKYNL